jgi:hypothetical protein
MLSADLKNQVIALPIRDRLELVQAIVESLQNHPLAHLESNTPYKVWTPIDAPQAAQVLLDLLEADTQSTYV